MRKPIALLRSACEALLNEINLYLAWSVPLSISVCVLYPEHPLKLPHHLMINMRFLLLIANGDGLRTMVIPMKEKVVNYTWYRNRRERKSSSNIPNDLTEVIPFYYLASHKSLQWLSA